MSRTHKGSKIGGRDYWSKRPYNSGGYTSYLQPLTHRKERMQDKQHLHNTLKDTENLVEQSSRVVYPLKDERVKALAVVSWGRHSTEYLMEENTHYSIEEDWFCNPDFLQANDLPADVAIGNYDDYLKEQSDVN